MSPPSNDKEFKPAKQPELFPARQQKSFSGPIRPSEDFNKKMVNYAANNPYSSTNARPGNTSNLTLPAIPASESLSHAAVLDLLPFSEVDDDSFDRDFEEEFQKIFGTSTSTPTPDNLIDPHLLSLSSPATLPAANSSTTTVSTRLRKHRNANPLFTRRKPPNLGPLTSSPATFSGQSMTLGPLPGISPAASSTYAPTTSCTTSNTPGFTFRMDTGNKIESTLPQFNVVTNSPFAFTSMSKPVQFNFMPAETMEGVSNSSTPPAQALGGDLHSESTPAEAIGDVPLCTSEPAESSSELCSKLESDLEAAKAKANRFELRIISKNSEIKTLKQKLEKMSKELEENKDAHTESIWEKQLGLDRAQWERERAEWQSKWNELEERFAAEYLAAVNKEGAAQKALAAIQAENLDLTRNKVQIEEYWAAELGRMDESVLVRVEAEKATSAKLRSDFQDYQTQMQAEMAQQHAAWNQMFCELQSRLLSTEEANKNLQQELENSNKNHQQELENSKIANQRLEELEHDQNQAQEVSCLRQRIEELESIAAEKERLSKNGEETDRQAYHQQITSLESALEKANEGRKVAVDSLDKFYLMLQSAIQKTTGTDELPSGLLAESYIPESASFIAAVQRERHQEIIAGEQPLSVSAAIEKPDPVAKLELKTGKRLQMKLEAEQKKVADLESDSGALKKGQAQLTQQLAEQKAEVARLGAIVQTFEPRLAEIEVKASAEKATFERSLRILKKFQKLEEKEQAKRESVVAALESQSKSNTTSRSLYNRWKAIRSAREEIEEIMSTPLPPPMIANPLESFLATTPRSEEGLGAAAEEDTGPHHGKKATRRGRRPSQKKAAAKAESSSSKATNEEPPRLGVRHFVVLACIYCGVWMISRVV